jgi:hypothetical protein
VHAVRADEWPHPGGAGARRAAAGAQALDAVCDDRQVDREVVELVLQALRREIPADAARARVSGLQSVERAIHSSQAPLQGKKLELAKHDEPPTS